MKHFIEITIQMKAQGPKQNLEHKIKISEDAILYYRKYPIDKQYTIGLKPEYKNEIFHFNGFSLEGNVENVLASEAEIRRLETLVSR